MELWIRSQSRQNLMKANDIVVQDNEILVYKESEQSTIVGKYVTKERALEVLDEIQKLLMPTIEYQHNVLKGYDVKIEQAITDVYEMPKE